MSIKVEDLTYSYGNKNVLDSVEIQLRRKSFTGIIGPNGCGKSTLLKCIYRVLKPQIGTIWLEDKPLNSYSVKESSKYISVMAQHNSYQFDFKVKDIVMMGRAPHKRLLERDTLKDYQIVEKVLESVNMLEFLEREFATLSGGEQQRVLLARALAQDARTLILDEPTNHLDITYQLQLMRILKKQDITIFAAMHDLNIAAMYCDYLYIMKAGRVIAQGETNKILTPERIFEVYQVESQIVQDKNGKLHILFTGDQL